MLFSPLCPLNPIHLHCILDAPYELRHLTLTVSLHLVACTNWENHDQQNLLSFLKINLCVFVSIDL